MIALLMDNGYIRVPVFHARLSVTKRNRIRLCVPALA